MQHLNIFFRKKISGMAAPRVFIIEGEISVGKSFLVRALAEELERRGYRVQQILEPVDAWKQIGILERFYADPARHGYGFQTYVYATRIEAILAGWEAGTAAGADVYLLERCPRSDQVFMALQADVVDPVETQMYRTWCRVHDRLLPPALDLERASIIYVQTSLEESMRRLQQRDRQGEIRKGATATAAGTATGGVSLEYQQRLRAAHEQYLGLAPVELPVTPARTRQLLVLGPELVDPDWRAGERRHHVLDTIIERMELPAPALEESSSP